MDERLVRRIQGAGRSSKQELETSLAEALVAVSGGALTVRSARDSLSAVLGKARQGTIQVIGRKADDMTVVISLKDLVEAVSAAARPQTLAEALDAMGFKPASRRVTVRQGRKREPLTRYRESEGPNAKFAV